MHKYLLTFLASVAIAQSPEPAPQPPIVAQSIPAIAEPSWSFMDGGNAYFVGKQTGTVTVIRMDGRPAPAPTPQPTPPPVVVNPVAWATLILPADALTPDMAALRTDADIRRCMNDSKVVYRSYIDTETDVDTLKFRQYLSPQLRLPVLVLQDKDGAVISAKTVTDKAGVLNAIKP